VVTHDYYGISLVPAWQTYRDQRTSVRNGPSGSLKDYVTRIATATPDRVQVEFCNYDDGVTVDATGVVVDDRTVVHNANADLVLDSGRWLIDRTAETATNDVPQGAANPCIGQWLLR
jgi:hypothetical protein